MKQGGEKACLCQETSGHIDGQESASTCEALCHGMLVCVPAGNERSCLCQKTSGEIGR